jgi:fluoroacetyl-CoA thioesterase
MASAGWHRNPAGSEDRGVNELTEVEIRANDSVESSALSFQGFFTAMAKPIPIGTRGTAEETVAFEHTLASRHPDLPPVYSTPDMIRLMEIAAFFALQPYCEGDEITVGTSIHIEHRAASGIGAKVRADATLESFDGRFYTVGVIARDDTQEIGRGTVGRAVVSVGKFLEKIKGTKT